MGIAVQLVRIERLRAFLSGRGFLLALGGVLLVQSLACLYLIKHSYFFAEDFMFLQLYERQPLDYDQLTQPVFGHLIPAFIAFNKYFGAWFGANWALAGMVTLAIQLGGTVAFARLLLALAGRAWWVPGLTAAFACSVVVLNTSPWWAATMTIQIALAACISVWGCAVRFAVTQRARHLVGLTVAYGVALAFWEKSLVTCAYLGLFVLILGIGSRRATLGERIRECLRLWPVWAILLVLSMADLAVYASGDYLESAGDPASPGMTAEFLVRNLTEGLFPALFGAAYPDSVLPGPAWLTWVVATGLVAALVVWTSMRSAVARRTWLWLGISVVASQVLVARGRLGIMGVDQTAHELRYQLDTTYLFLVATAIALPAALAAAHDRERHRARFVALIAPLVLLPLWLQSVHTIGERTPGAASREYFHGLRSGEAARGHFLNLPVPEWIVAPNMYPWNMAERIYPEVRPGTKVGDDSQGALGLSFTGQVGTVTLEPVGAPADPGEVCITADSEPVEILSSDTALPPADVHTPLLRFRYTTAAWAAIHLSVSSPAGEAPLGGLPRTHRLAAGEGEFAAYVSARDWTSLTVEVRRGGPLCVSDVQIVQPAG